MMSSMVGKPTLLKAIAKCNYSAKPSFKSAVTGSELEASVSSKNSRLVALKEDSPILKVALSYKVGAAYEEPGNLGITHAIRAATGLSTKNFTTFNIHKSLPQYGINLYATTDRESFSYVVETHKDQLDRALNYLTDVGTFPLFKPWEIEDYRSRLNLELSVIPPEVKVIELLHGAAYNGSLGNSLYINESRIGKFSFEDYLEFFNKNFTFPRLQVTALGLDLKFLGEYLTAIELEADPAPALKSKYAGREYRESNYKENAAYVAIAGESPGLNKKESLAYGILKYVYGIPPAIKYGKSQGILSKALNEAGITAAVVGFNAVYADSGLTGFYLIALPQEADTALKAVYSKFLKADITDDDVKRGKALFKADVFSKSEGNKLVDYIGKQVGYDAITTPEQLVAAIDTVSEADVKQAAKKLASSKLSSAYYGNIDYTPSLTAL